MQKIVFVQATSASVAINSGSASAGNHIASGMSRGMHPTMIWALMIPRPVDAIQLRGARQPTLEKGDAACVVHTDTTPGITPGVYEHRSGALFYRVSVCDAPGLRGEVRWCRGLRPPPVR